nr:SRPBCC domain-containing protein [Neobacillus sp. Marseille-Q6967]
MSENTELKQVTTHVEGKVLVIERVFNAPRDLVFKAYSESDLLAKWWGPQGWQTENRRFEFQPNGVWHYVMRCNDKNQGDFYGQESWGKGVYHEIIAPEKIVYTDSFSDTEGNDAEGMPAMEITLNFVEQDGKTNVVTRSQFASAESLQQVMEMGVVQGFSSQMDRLDDLLDEMQSEK